MNILSLSLTQFRNHLSSKFDTQGAPAVLLSGDNGAGKTSVLEAIHLLSTGIGIRSRRDSDFVRFDTDREAGRSRPLGPGPYGYRIDAALSSGRSVAMRFRGTVRQAFVDGEPLARWGELIGLLRMVLLKPEDILLIEGPPETRRRFLDIMLCQAERPYFEALRRYRRAAKQKNKVSAGTFQIGPRHRGVSVAGSFEELMAREMPLIFAVRHAACGELEKNVNQLLSSTGSAGYIQIAYRPAVPKKQGPGHSSWEQAAAACLEEGSRLEAAGSSSPFGPARDEVAISLDGVALRSFGSQGQKRMISLLLRLAEANFLSREGDEAVVLVDDVLGELDAVRKEDFLTLLSSSKSLKEPSMKQIWIADTDTKIYEERWAKWIKFDIKDGISQGAKIQQ